MNNKAMKTFAPWALLVAILLAWQLVCSAFSVSEFIFPSPTAIVESLIEYAGPIAAHACSTYWVTMAGFGIAVAVGLALGFLIGSSPTLYAAAYPLMTAFNALPKAAFVPAASTVLQPVQASSSTRVPSLSKMTASMFISSPAIPAWNAPPPVSPDGHHGVRRGRRQSGPVPHCSWPGARGRCGYCLPGQCVPHRLCA